MNTLILSLILIAIIYQNFYLLKKIQRTFDIKYPLFSEKNIDDTYKALIAAGKLYQEIINRAHSQKDATKAKKDEYLNCFIYSATEYYYLMKIYELAIDLNVAILNGKKFQDARLEWCEFTDDSEGAIRKKISKEVSRYKNFDAFLSSHIIFERRSVSLYLENIKR